MNQLNKKPSYNIFVLSYDIFLNIVKNKKYYKWGFSWLSNQKYIQNLSEEDATKKNLKIGIFWKNNLRK